MRIVGEVVGQELQGDVAAELEVFRFIDHTHPAAPKFLDDAVVRDGPANHWCEMLRLGNRQVNESLGVGGISKKWLAKNRISDNVGGVKFVLSTLQRALMEERHFALVAGFCVANRRLAS
ncbi:MAG: hypothetical protein WB755_02010 [Terriglobales bacterium]